MWLDMLQLASLPTMHQFVLDFPQQTKFFKTYYDAWNPHKLVSILFLKMKLILNGNMIKHSVNFRHSTHNVSKIEQKIPHFSKQMSLHSFLCAYSAIYTIYVE